MAIKSIKKIFKKFSKNEVVINSNISISNEPNEPKFILMIFPIKKEFFRVASYTYRNLPYNKNKTTFHYIINDNYSDSFSLRKGEVHKIKLDKKMNIINKDNLLNSIKNIDFDIIIDLNVEYEPLIHDFISQNSNYKVGFKHKQSDLLYNVQLDISKCGIAEKGYQQILELI
tara:strand:+ start:808 stop:1323 length:516 start_codon:yes stop_codon:yes gene_type:complete